MTKLYVVSMWEDYECPEIIGIYSSLELAKSEGEKVFNKIKRKEMHNLETSEYVLDKTCGYYELGADIR